ncbi:hypothetical protein D9M69_612320 [compost metagenome]
MVDVVLHNALTDRVIRYMCSSPHSRYTAREIARQFRRPLREILAILEKLTEHGRVCPDSVTNGNVGYYLTTRTPTHRYVPEWRELRGWEATMRRHVELCEMTRRS